jgi:flagellar hook-associated protein 2
VRVAGEEHRLVVTSTTTGADAAFTTSSTIASLAAGSTVLQQGGDAELTMDGLAISRPTNRIDDLVPGISLQLSDVGATTIRIDQDLEGATKKVKALVDGMNGLLSELGRQGATAADASGRGPLSGDPLVRRLATQLRGSLSQVVAQDGPFRTLNDLGISLTRDGRITLDEAKLRTALSTDPEAAGKILGRAGSASDARVGVTSVGRAVAGDYQLEVTKAPRIAAATGASFAPSADISPKTFTITGADGTVVSVEIDDTVDVTTAIQRINAALAGTKLSWLRASAVDQGDGTTSIQLQADRAGSNRSFTVDGSEELGLDGTAAGVDAEATLTQAATGESWTIVGNGRSLTGPSGSAIAGMVVRVPLEVTGDLGTVTIDNGLAGVVDGVLRTAEGSGGSIARAREALEGRIRSAQNSLEAFETRLETRERTIRRQFTALETAMAQMQSQSAWLASQLAGMMG